MSYTTLLSVRAAGVPDATGSTDADVTAQIARWSEFIDRECRQWFESRALTITIDGNGTDTIHLPAPIIAVSALYVNENFITAVAATDYFVYSNREIPDDRSNPRVKLNPNTNIFSSQSNLLSAPIFERGRQNQRLVGTFGYLTKDDETPADIEDVCLRLVIRHFQNRPSYSGAAGSPGAGSMGPKSSETTDRHTVRYATPQITGMRMGSLAITGDPYIDAILQRYKGPKLISTSSSVVFQTRM